MKRKPQNEEPEQKNKLHENEALLVGKGEKVVEKRLKFEELLSNISSNFVNISTSEVAREIDRALGLIGEFLEVDQVDILKVSKNKTKLRGTNSWIRKGIKGFPVHDIHYEKIYPWYTSIILSGKTIILKRLKDYTGEVLDERQFLKDYRLNFSTTIIDGETITVRQHDEDSEESVDEKLSLKDNNLNFSLTIPLVIEGKVFGAIGMISIRREQVWAEELVPRLRLLGEIFFNAMNRKIYEETLQKAFSEIKELKDQLQADSIYLREEIKSEYDYEMVIGESDVHKKVLFKVDQVAPTDSTVLITGQTGTGKELVARAIHNASARESRPLLKVNCAALSPSLIESELFGHEKGAFTNAFTRKIGRFEHADGTTLLLDEIGELPLELQAKLLHVLQEGEFERIGSSSTIKVDVRVIAITNRILEEDIRKGQFREDLWYRLNVFPINVPPLNQRRGDIPLMVQRFVGKAAKKLGKKIKVIPQKTMEALQNYSWPGNVRELENMIERAVILSQDSTLKITDTLQLTGKQQAVEAQSMSLSEMERKHINQALETACWKIDGPRGAADFLDINPSTLRARMRKLGIKRP